MPELFHRYFCLASQLQLLSLCSQNCLCITGMQHRLTQMPRQCVANIWLQYKQNPTLVQPPYGVQQTPAVYKMITMGCSFEKNEASDASFWQAAQRMPIPQQYQPEMGPCCSVGCAPPSVIGMGVLVGPSVIALSSIPKTAVMRAFTFKSVKYYKLNSQCGFCAN